MDSRRVFICVISDSPCMVRPLVWARMLMETRCSAADRLSTDAPRSADASDVITPAFRRTLTYEVNEFEKSAAR